MGLVYPCTGLLVAMAKQKCVANIYIYSAIILRSCIWEVPCLDGTRAELPSCKVAIA